MKPIVMQRHFFEFERHDGVQNLTVVGSKGGSLRWREQLIIGFVDNVFTGQMEHVFESAIDKEIPASPVFDKD